MEAFKHFPKQVSPQRADACKRVAAYCRVSTEMELQEGSYELQQSYFRTLIESNPDMVLAGIYGDKGKSGRGTVKRPGLRQLLQDCEDANVDMVLVKSLSRFARNVSDCLAMVRRLRELQIPVIFEKEGINTMEGSGELLIAIMAAIAQEESNSISGNMRWSIDSHNAKGEPYHRTSYGYKREAKGSPKWIIDDDQAKRVRCAFDMAAAGKGYMEIIDRLNAMEAEELSEPSTKSNTKSKTGTKWNYHRLVYLLKNIAYTGDYLTNQQYTLYTDRRINRRNKGERDQYYITEHHSPIVSKEQFELVQQMLANGSLSSRKKNK